MKGPPSPPLLLSHFHILPCGWPMNAKQHGRIWKWIQGNLEMYRILEGGIDTSPVEKILNCLVSHFPFFNFKGTPSQEEHKTVPSVFSTVGSASTGRDLFLRSSVSAYSCCTVPRCPRTATVRRTTLPYIFLCWPAPIDGDDHQCTVYRDGTVQ